MLVVDHNGKIVPGLGQRRSAVMTTHIVEIRRKTTVVAPTIVHGEDWRALNKTPCSAEEASKLMRLIGHDWEARIMAVAVSEYALERQRFVERYGTDAMLQQFNAGLAEEAVLVLARKHLFEAFESPETFGLMLRDPVRWGKTTRARLHHKATCPRHADSAGESWHVERAKTITEDQWLASRGMNASLVLVQQRALAVGLTITAILTPPARHHGECEECGATASAVSIGLEIQWGQSMMVREYVL
jgi:hypothetical protein